VKDAQKLGDAARVTRITIRIKEVFFAASGGMFTLTAYKNIRSTDSFGRSTSMGAYRGGRNSCWLTTFLISYVYILK